MHVAIVAVAVALADLTSGILRVHNERLRDVVRSTGAGAGTTEVLAHQPRGDAIVIEALLDDVIDEPIVRDAIDEALTRLQADDPAAASRTASRRNSPRSTASTCA